jgi:hypothetical protein
MENSCLTNLAKDEKIIPTDSEFLKGYASFLSFCDRKKCCKKYKKGKRCKKCPNA